MTAINNHKDGSIPGKLFIFDLANNHMGDVEHGCRVIREVAAVCRDFPQFNFGFKMQYRHLDTFIHPAFQGRSDIKYIKRFSETRLSREDTLRLVATIKEEGFIAICTPFDEHSVDTAVEDGFDILKIASCSLTDWPLLEKLAQASGSRPLIASTAGSPLAEVDAVVAFFEHRAKELVVMHCVADYPTKLADLQLNQIDLLRARYPQIGIGYSTHEDPNETVPAAIAIGKGAVALEKHVGVPTSQYALNGYSANPAQVRAWLEAADRAYIINGLYGERCPPTETEQASLMSLRRGVFVKRDIAVGERLHSSDIFLAIPTQPGQVTANDWSKYTHFVASAPIAAGEAVLDSNASRNCVRARVWDIVTRVKDIVKAGNVIVPHDAQMEISHHYGLERFDEVGIAIITIVNREYCKKLIVLLPGQTHPVHTHRQKEETFHVLHGKVTIALDGVSQDYTAGSVVVVERGVAHSFESAGGAVFEEISSTHFVNDSHYTDQAILANADRKTFVTHWMD